MRIVLATVLLAFATYLDAEDSVETPATKLADNLADRLVSDLVDSLFKLTLRVTLCHSGELRNATLGKPSRVLLPDRVSLKCSLPYPVFRRAFAPYTRAPSRCIPLVRLGATLERHPAEDTQASSTTRTLKLIGGLQSVDFQHPLDKQAGEALRLFAPLEWGMRQAFTGLIDDAVFLENIASGVLVGPKQLPDVYSMLLESCRVLSLSTIPDLYIRQSPYPNAYTLAFQGRRPFIVVTTALLDLLNPIETQAVIAHELGHLKCEHSLLIAMANLLLSPLASLLPAGNAALQTSLLQWQRSAELSCDRAALLAVQDVRAVQGVIMKLCGGGTTYAQRMDVDAFVRQATAYDEVAKRSGVGQFVRQSQLREASHPLPILRARELERFAASDQYAALLKRGKPITTRIEGALENQLEVSNGSHGMTEQGGNLPSSNSDFAADSSTLAYNGQSSGS